jgi:cytochrome P450
MPLKLKQPPPDDAQVVPEPELTQGAIDRFRAQIDAYIDAFVAEQRKQMPNQPPEALRAMLLRGQCLCTAAARLLKEPR